MLDQAKWGGSAKTTMLFRGVESEEKCHVRNNCTTLCLKGDSVGPLHCKGRGYRWYEQEMTSFVYGHAFITWVGDVRDTQIALSNQNPRSFALNEDI